MKRHGYKGFGPRVEWNHASGIETAMSAQAHAEAKRAGHIEDLRRYIDQAADLGCSLIRTFGSPRGGGKLIPAVEHTSYGYRQIVDEADAAGVTVLMETHDDWCASAAVRSVVEAVDHPRVKVLWDFMHPQRLMERPEESSANLGDLTLHVHAHDGRIVDDELLVGPLGAGIFDHATPLNMLKNAGFGGYFSVEVVHAPGSDHDADGVLANYAEVFRSW